MSVSQQLESMERKLDATFPLWPQNAEKMLRDPEDVAFLARMKGDRRATFGALDTKLHAKLKRRENVRLGQRLERHARKEQQMFNTVVMKGEGEDSDVDVVAPEQAPTARTRQRKKTGIPAVLQRPNLVSPQLKMTTTQQAAYTRGLIEESGGDASKASTS